MDPKYSDAVKDRERERELIIISIIIIVVYLPQLSVLAVQCSALSCPDPSHQPKYR